MKILNWCWQILYILEVDGWIHTFVEVQDEIFYLTSSNQITVKMMYFKRDLLYYHDDDLKFGAVEFPYEVLFIVILIHTKMQSNVLVTDFTYI